MGLLARLGGWLGAGSVTRRRGQFEAAVGILYPLADVAVIVGASVLAFVLHFKLELGPETPYRKIDFFLPAFVVYALAFVIAGLAFHAYRDPDRMSVVVRTYRLITAATLALLATIGALYFASPGILDFARVLLVFLWLLVIAFTVILRTILGRSLRILAHFGIGSERVLILGGGPEALAVYDLLVGYPGPRYTVIGRLQDDADADAEIPIPVLGPLQILCGALIEHAIDKVVIALPRADSELLLEIAGVCGAQRVNVWMLPDHFQLMVSMVGEEQLAGLPLMTINDVRLKGVSRLTKRLVDIVASTLLLIILSAPLLLIALAVWIDSRGQIFYVQQRMGHDGKRFSMIKFRSMRADAEAQGRNWTVADDPRVTRVGRFLRRFSLDEMPQLMNVLKGEMSLVGPRPERPEYVERFGREYPRFLERHREKAGMSGWAQVNGLRGDVSITERTLYDLYYVENWSLGLDLRILLRTIVEVVRGRAY
jgi:exopolysaccharide biosynthesis polyprenyl glycosylphosphotransferase